MSFAIASLIPPRRLSPGPLLLPLALAACSLRPYTFGESDTDGGATDTTSLTATTEAATTGNIAPGTTTASASSSTSTDSTTDQNTTTASLPPDIELGEHCSVWDEDCPEGQKCMPYSADGDPSWDGTRCVDIVPDPDGLNEPCMVLGPPSSGEDTCDKHMHCWDPDPDTGIGTCLGMCLGTPDAPSCADTDAVCALAADALFIPCLPICDPLAANCAADEVCTPNMWSFYCLDDSFSRDKGQAFDPCEYIHACDPGLFCASPMLAAECDPVAIGCCIPFCDISQPNTCPGQGQECLAWYEPGEAPPGLEHVGACALPP